VAKKAMQTCHGDGQSSSDPCHRTAWAIGAIDRATLFLRGIIVDRDLTFVGIVCPPTIIHPNKQIFRPVVRYLDAG
jgi:hypothetical protein